MQGCETISFEVSRSKVKVTQAEDRLQSSL